MKNRIRNMVKEKIENLDKTYCMRADYKIAETLYMLPEYNEAKLVFCFVGTINEINTKTIICNALEAGKSVAVPKCIGKGIMEAYSISSLDDLEEGYQGILEPKCSCELIPPEKINLAIIPCLSANQKGQRLGYGGGYYDRYLCRTKAIRLVLCREMLVNEEIPVEEHDQVMDIVLTEERVIRIIE